MLLPNKVLESMEGLICKNFKEKDLEPMGLSTISYLRMGPTSQDGGKTDTVDILVTSRRVNSEALIQTVAISSLCLTQPTISLKTSVGTAISPHLNFSLNSRGLYPKDYSRECDNLLTH